MVCILNNSFLVQYIFALLKIENYKTNDSWVLDGGTLTGHARTCHQHIFTSWSLCSDNLWQIMNAIICTTGYTFLFSYTVYRLLQFLHHLYNSYQYVLLVQRLLLVSVFHYYSFHFNVFMHEIVGLIYIMEMCVT